jgi:UPF0042 nucleotide-binding protein
MSVDLVVVTGMSGAGRSTTAKCLEDLGWFVVDNLPPSLLGTMVDLGERSQGQVERIAVVADARSGALSDLQAALAELDDRDARVRVIFLEASDEALVRRFESNRRPHPLQGDGRLVDGIEAERALLRELRGEADLVLDTSVLNVHELRTKVAAAFGDEGAPPRVSMTLMSFGYKYGLPVDADLVVDCRFLPNPHWVEELRPLTGQDGDVRAYVLGQRGAGEFLERMEGLVRLLLEGYEREGKHYVLLAVGCTGGKHRSVAMTEELARRLEAPGLEVQVQHRDLGRE